MDANVQVSIKGASGSTVRNLVTRAASAGQMQLTWDYKDNRGVSIPAGQYVIDVKATTSDGQSAHVTAPHVVVR
jgi:flagellar hook assembly protein FlgD